jgi:hypothetical protein
MYMPLYIPLYSHIVSDDFSVVVASPKVTPLRLVFLRHQRPLEPWHPQISWMGKTRENPIEMDGMYERGTTMDHETSMFVLHKDLNPPFFAEKETSSNPSGADGGNVGAATMHRQNVTLHPMLAPPSGVIPGHVGRRGRGKIGPVFFSTKMEPETKTEAWIK